MPLLFCIIAVGGFAGLLWWLDECYQEWLEARRGN